MFKLVLQTIEKQKKLNSNSGKNHKTTFCKELFFF